MSKESIILKYISKNYTINDDVLIVYDMGNNTVKKNIKSLIYNDCREVFGFENDAIITAINKHLTLK